MKKKGIFSTLLIFVFAIVIISGCLQEKSETKSGESESITILWAEMEVSNSLQNLTYDFTKETGIQVKIIQEPWSTFQTIFFNEMSRKGDAYDMVGGDSQWLGMGSIKGNYVELTSWVKENSVDQTMIDSAMKWYSEYPIGSGHYWAVPLNGDALSFAYRKDLFEDPEEKAKFREKYGYDLDIPQTWSQFRDIAEFFNRPDKGLNGLSLWTSKDYDGTTMGVETFIWAWGGELGDYKTYQVQGSLNSKESIEALQFYKDLYKYHPPQYPDVYFESLDAFSHGKVSMAMTYFAVDPTLNNPSLNPYANVTGYFSSPKGPVSRMTALAGQGLSVISYSKKKDLSLKFLKWFIQEDVQKKWAQMGGLSCNKNVMKSEAFLNLTPYNRNFAESMEFVKDFWAVPEYIELMNISQNSWHQYILTNETTAQDTMNKIVYQWEKVFDQAGYYKE